jgi:hypothetical protein
MRKTLRKQTDVRFGTAYGDIYHQAYFRRREAGKFLPTMYVSAKPSLKAAVAETRKNLAERRISRGGIKSLVYAFKPLLLIFVPEFIFRIYRNRE